jgi:hypothetical protein
MKPSYPNVAQKQLWTLLEALRRGEKLTVMVSLQKYACYALSQRMGELRGLGWKVQSQRITLKNGKCVSEYWLAKS